MNIQPAINEFLGFDEATVGTEFYKIMHNIEEIARELTNKVEKNGINGDTQTIQEARELLQELKNEVRDQIPQMDQRMNQLSSINWLMKGNNLNIMIESLKALIEYKKNNPYDNPGVEKTTVSVELRNFLDVNDIVNVTTMKDNEKDYFLEYFMPNISHKLEQLINIATQHNQKELGYQRKLGK